MSYVQQVYTVQVPKSQTIQVPKKQTTSIWNRDYNVSTIQVLPRHPFVGHAAIILVCTEALSRSNPRGKVGYSERVVGILLQHNQLQHRT